MKEIYYILAIICCGFIILGFYLFNLKAPVTQNDIQLTDIEDKFKPFPSENNCWACGKEIENKHPQALCRGLCNSCTNNEKN